MRTTKTRHFIWWKFCFWALVILMGVGTSSHAHAADTKSPSGQPTKTCQAQATSLSKWLMAYALGLDRQPTFIALPDEVELVSIDQPPTVVDGAIVVLLSPSGTTVDGEVVSGDRLVLIDRMRTALARQQSMASLTGQPVTQTLVLAVDRRTTWQQVVDTVDAAKAAGAVSVALAFRSAKTPRVPTPGPSPFDQRLIAIRKAKDPSARSEGLAALSSSLVAACPPMQAPLTTMAKHPAERPSLRMDPFPGRQPI